MCSLASKEKNDYNDLELSNVTDKRKLWKTMRNDEKLFANKIKVKNKIALDEDQKVANIFNFFFVNTATDLNISYNKSLPQNKDISEIVEHAIKKYFENHSSIIAIKVFF